MVGELALEGRGLGFAEVGQDEEAERLGVEAGDWLLRSTAQVGAQHEGDPAGENGVDHRWWNPRVGGRRLAPSAEERREAVERGQMMGAGRRGGERGLDENEAGLGRVGFDQGKQGAKRGGKAIRPRRPRRKGTEKRLAGRVDDLVVGPQEAILEIGEDRLEDERVELGGPAELLKGGRGIAVGAEGPRGSAEDAMAAGEGRRRVNGDWLGLD